MAVPTPQRRLLASAMALLLVLASSGAGAVAFAGPIKTVVVVVMENRSFDHMLGWMKRLNPAIDGVTGAEWNPANASDPSAGPRVYFGDGAQFVDPDPGHSYQEIRQQVFGSDDASGPPLMNGFVQQARSIGGGNMTEAVMNGFAPDSVAVYRELVAQFAVCDRWFASVPSSTQPNRLFVHSGTSGGATSNNPDLDYTGWVVKSVYNQTYPVAGRSYCTIACADVSVKQSGPFIVRVPAILISPWIEKGTVMHGPNGSPTPTSQFEHSSIPATVKKLFNLPQDFLTKRDAWAGTFEGVVQTRTEPRTDCPEQLPTPTRIRQTEANEEAKLSSFQQEIVQLAAVLNGDHQLSSLQERIRERMNVREGTSYMRSSVRRFFEAGMSAKRMGLADEEQIVKMRPSLTTRTTTADQDDRP
ncbi:non-specific phospholipase C2-like [Triticum dicoccoides]|uniref:non-specific phospholipase C2-like n=1 Tax=Triticum dicoccoides TaxID=85692 RepID=UPI00188F0954|nr:non-specific phospholipase C2-like [Triticum dicoccoides]